MEDQAARSKFDVQTQEMKYAGHLLLIAALTLTVTVFTLSSCTYRNRQEILNGVCDTSSVTYSGVVAGIMTDYCTSCHGGASPSAGISLESYAQVKTFVSNGQLWGTMNHESGFKPMPQGTPKLDACTLNKLYAWISSGAPNN